MKIKIKMKSRSHRYDKNRPGPNILYVIRNTKAIHEIVKQQ